MGRAEPEEKKRNADSSSIPPISPFRRSDKKGKYRRFKIFPHFFVPFTHLFSYCYNRLILSKEVFPMLIKEFAKIGKRTLRAITNTLPFRTAVFPPLPSPSPVSSSLSQTHDLETYASDLEAKLSDRYQVLQAEKYVSLSGQSKEYEPLAVQAIKSIRDFDERRRLHDALTGNETVSTSPLSSDNPAESDVLCRTEEKRLPKYAVLQLLFYHFLQVDENGVIQHVSEKMVAHALSCSPRTIRNNNRILEEAGLIFCSRSGNGINIWIRDYSDYHHEGGSGYERMTYPFFEELVKLDMVNSVRYMIRQELKYDNDTPKRKYAKKQDDLQYSKLSFNDAKVFLPKYTHYAGMIQTFATASTSVFETKLDHSDVYFVMNANYYGKHLYELREKEYTSKLTGFLENYDDFVTDHITSSDLKSFTQLCFEYGLSRVEDALNQMVHLAFYSPDAELIQNKGGYLRHYIRTYILPEERYNAPVLISA